MATGRRRGAALFLCLVLGGGDAAGQVGGAGIGGLITDPSGAAVADVVVKVANVATAEIREARTSGAGLFSLAALAPGEYRVRIEHAGFTPQTRQLQLVTGETLRLDVELSVARIDEDLTVTAPARSDAPGLGHVVAHQQVLQLPLNGRSFISLVALAPGVALPPGSAFPRINGGRPRVNEYLFDGISVLQPEPGQVPILPIVDAIQEFRIETNSPSAEFGRFNGGVVNLTTRSGTNALTGDVFGFLRHEALNARNVFAPKTAERPDKPGTTVWSVFKQDTKYFAPSESSLMLNYRVENLQEVLNALRAEGAWVDDKIEESEFGKFGWIFDPEGNKIELWDPSAGA
jgi:hypothetical protein